MYVCMYVCILYVCVCIYVQEILSNAKIPIMILIVKSLLKAQRMMLKKFVLFFVIQLMYVIYVYVYMHAYHDPSKGTKNGIKKNGPKKWIKNGQINE